jgi:hypothetical protein
MARFTVSAALVLILAGPALAQYPPYPAYPPAASDPQAMVEGWYARFLHRRADYGAAGWVNQLRQGQSPAHVLGIILSSEEYYLRAGGTPPAFIQALFLDLTGQQPSPAQLDGWLRRMRFMSRKDIAYQVLIRYPQAWQGAGPTYYPDQPNPYPQPYYNPYDYRRPAPPYGWGR